MRAGNSVVATTAAIAACALALALPSAAGAAPVLAPAPGGQPPAIAAAGSIACAGTVLTATAADWAPGVPVTSTFQWQRQDPDPLVDWQDIPGATGTTHTLTSGDHGLPVRVVETADDGAGTTVLASAATAAVSVPANTTLPSVPPGAQMTRPLTASPGTWTNACGPASYSYQWESDTFDVVHQTPSAIPGAISATYTPVVADVGAHLRVTVHATNIAGTSAAAASAWPAATTLPLAPVVQSNPAIIGTAQDGLVLTATTGTWTPLPTQGYTYGWEWCDPATLGACNAFIGTWTTIPGATAGTYQAAPADVGHVLRVRVVAHGDGGASQPAASAATALVQPPSAPVSLTSPVVSGTPQLGATLTATTGTWLNTPTSVTFQWETDVSGPWTAIPGATAGTYTPTYAASVAGGRLRVKATATNAGGSAPAISAATGAVVPDPPAVTSPPVLSGTAQDGATLSVTTGTWDRPATYAYQWYRGAQAIAGQTTATLVLTGADVGQSIHATVTATATSGASVPATSNASVSVLPTAPASVVAPAVGGTAQVGFTLHADTGTFSPTPTSLAAQWQRFSGGSWIDIPLAVDLDYAPVTADAGKTLRVQVVATGPGGTSAAAHSLPTPAIQDALPAPSTAPGIVGGAHVGQTLTLTTGTWAPGPATFAQRWQREVGGAWVDIPLATAATYLVDPADLGLRLRAQVTATNAVGSATVATTPTAAVDGPPASLVAPVVTGTGRVADDLTLDRGTWSGAPTGWTVTWERRAGSAWQTIDEAAGALVYRPTAADAGRTIRASVQATNAAGTSAAATAAAVTVAPFQAATARPSISGTVKVGIPLTAVPGDWTGAPDTFRYRWQRLDGSGFADIAGADGEVYVPAAADAGAVLRVLVAGQGAGGLSAWSASPSTAAVASDPPPAPPAPLPEPVPAAAAPVVPAAEPARAPAPAPAPKPAPAPAPAPKRSGRDWLVLSDRLHRPAHRVARLRLTAAESGAGVRVTLAAGTVDAPVGRYELRLCVRTPNGPSTCRRAKLVVARTKRTPAITVTIPAADGAKVSASAALIGVGRSFVANAWPETGIALS